VLSNSGTIRGVVVSEVYGGKIRRSDLPAEREQPVVRRKYTSSAVIGGSPTEDATGVPT